MSRWPGLYVHVPFCKGKCPYCDFYSVDARDQIDRYIDDIEMEAELCPGFEKPVDSLYVGGGTPSQLSSEQVKRLFDILRTHYLSRLPDGEVEITVEVNPADVDDNLLKCLEQAGVNRLSLGVQSFEDTELSRLGRRHDRENAIRSIEMIRKADFATLGLDLIYNLPGSKTVDWRNNLEQALSFKPEHLSCYALTISPDTPFGRMRAQGKLKESSDSMCSYQYFLACEIYQKAGYDHYEVSNYARKPKYRSRHNRKYWQRIPNLGLGPAAHSFDGVKRCWNTTDLDDYHKRLCAGIRPHAGVESIDQDQAFMESVALGMRTAQGVELGLIEGRSQALQSVENLLEENLVNIADGRLCPTEKGMLFADGITKLLI